jgi:hypothetical protein
MRLNEKNSGITEIIVIILLALSSTYKVVGIFFPWYIRTLSCLLIIVICFFKKNHLFEIDRKTITIARQFILPVIILFCYSIIIIMINRGPRDYYTREISVFVQLILCYITPLAIVIKFNQFAPKIIISGVVLSSIVSTIAGIYVMGVGEFFRYLVNPISMQYGLTARVFEQHDLAFSMVFIIFYYFAIERKRSRLRNISLGMSFLIIWLAAKRVEMIAIPIGITIYYLIRKLSRTSMRIFILGLSSAIILFSLWYLYVIKHGVLNQILSVVNINSSGRNVLFETAFINVPLDISFFGIGFRLASKELFLNLQSLARVEYSAEISLHNDLLDMYIGVGMIGFISWIIYYFCHILLSLGRNVSVNTQKYSVVCLGYCFVTYLTDNTLSYFTFQMLLLSTIIFSFRHEVDNETLDNCTNI